MAAKRMRTVIAVALAGALVSPAAGQEWVSPIYKLPAEATGVEYTWQSLSDGDKDKKGKLTISVGKRDGPTRWVTFAMTPSDESQPEIWRKALFDEATFEKERNPRTAVREIWGKQGRDGEYKPLPIRERDALLTLGVEGKLRRYPTKTQVKLAVGSYPSTFAENEDPNRKFHYKVWLVPEIPFGWASFTINVNAIGGNERTLFRADFVGVSRP